MKDEPKKVVILGGGVGGVTAAFALTAPELAGRYDVTLYQMGWRLGGKGASGRDANASQRIEEHGLHIWLGFYHNAFDQMKACYDELGRDPAAPLGTFAKAFRPQSVGTLWDRWKGEWSPWVIPMPVTTDPLTGGDHPSVLAHIEMLLEWMARALTSDVLAEVLIDTAIEALERLAKRIFNGIGHILKGALDAIHELRAGRSTHQETLPLVVEGLRSLQHELHEAFARGLSSSDDARRIAHVIDIGCAAIIGLYETGVLTRGVHFQSLDDRELKQFLVDYGCHRASLDSPVLRGYYDLAFGFRRGDLGLRNEDTGAGTALNAILRVCFEYRGDFMWRMEAGMGDTIFGPYYEVLKRRGVKFRFFRRVERLEVGEDPKSSKPRIERIHLARQVDVIGGDDAFRPLVDVKGLPSWPSDPDFSQLVQGKAVENGPNGAPYDLESRWSGWKDVGRETIEPDAFDHVVLAIPVGAHPIICSELMDASPRYRAMVEHVKTVQTFGVQLWLDRGIDEMGWNTPSVLGVPQPAVADAYADPLNSFADNSHLIPMEDWKEPNVPKTLLYFCGVLPDELPPDGRLPPPSDTAFPIVSANRVKEMSIDWLEKHWAPILPKASCGDGIDWMRLVDPENRVGKARFDSQFWRANIDPSERYVLTVAGSTKHRLTAGDSQFEKLVLAGDWVDTGFSVGCVEAATMGGLQAARAITGSKKPIYGEHTVESADAQTAPGPAPAPPPAPGPNAPLPPFIAGPGCLELSPPYKFKKLEIRSFPLVSTPEKLQKLVDRLNVAPPEVCEFRAVGNLVYMQLAVYPYLESEADPEGWFQENELSFNILVACGKRVNGIFVATSLAYYFPFIYVDNDWAIATGREVFGYDKVASKMHFGAEGDRELFHLKTLALPVERATERARMVKLVSILETEKLTGWRKVVREVAGTLLEIGDLLIGPGGLISNPTLGVASSLVKTFAKQKIGIVSLKQFRDAATPDRACYQAVVQTEFHIDKWHQCALMPGKFAARILKEDSMPIVEAFGLQVNEDGLIQTAQPFVMTYDCTVTTGTNLYVAR